MRRRVVIVMAAVLLLLVAGAGAWLWQRNGIEGRIGALPSVSSVDVGTDWARVDFERSTDADEMSEALRRIFEIRDSEGGDRLWRISVELGPVEFDVDDPPAEFGRSLDARDPESSPRRLAAIACGIAAISSAEQGIVGPGTVHVVVGEGEDVLAATQALLRKFARSGLDKFPYLLVGDGDHGHSQLDLDAERTFDVAKAQGAVDRIARSLSRSGARFGTGSIYGDDTRLTALVDSPSDVSPARRMIMQTFGSHPLELTVNVAGR